MKYQIYYAESILSVIIFVILLSLYAEHNWFDWYMLVIIFHDASHFHVCHLDDKRPHDSLEAKLLSCPGVKPEQ